MVTFRLRGKGKVKSLTLNKILLLCIVFVPILGAFVLPLLGRFSKSLRNISSLILILIPLIFSISLVPSALNGNVTIINIPLVLGFNFVFNADLLALFMAMASSFISAIIVFYSFGYIDHYEYQNEYYLMVTLFLGSMMGLIYSGNLIFIYLFWEMTALASWRLIGFFRDKKYVLKADKAFLITVFGALLMLIGFIMLYSMTGSFDLAVIKESLKNTQIPNIVILLILAGIFAKSATLPFHTWLPDAGVAPSPVTALLHAAVLVKIGVYFFARLFVFTLPLGTFLTTVVPIVAGVSALLSAGAALIETDIKRIIAFSTISQIGFIFLGLSTGNPIGIAGALLFILMHGLAKGGLFLCAGIIEQNTHTKDIRELGGLFATMPLTAISFLLCAFSIMGIPPLGGFFSKYMVFMGAVQSGNIYITLFYLFTAFLTVLYLFRVFNMVFMGQTKISAKEGSFTMVASVVTLAVLSLAAGIFIYYPAIFVNQIVGLIR